MHESALCISTEMMSSLPIHRCESTCVSYGQVCPRDRCVSPGQVCVLRPGVSPSDSVHHQGRAGALLSLPSCCEFTLVSSVYLTCQWLHDTNAVLPRALPFLGSQLLKGNGSWPQGSLSSSTARWVGPCDRLPDADCETQACPLS